MQTENNYQEKVRSKISIKKVLLWTLLFLSVAFLIPFFAIPAYLSSGSGRNFILGKINDSLDGKVNVDSISMGWFSGVTADRLNFTNPSGSTKMTAEKIAAFPSYLSLLGGRVSIDQAVIDKPYLSITIDKTKTQETKGASTSEAGPKSSPPAIPLNKVNLTINQGNCKIIAPDAMQVMQTLELKNINSKIAIRPLGSKSSFDVSMTVAGANEVSDISAAGEIKTYKEWSLAGANGNLSVEVNDLELATLSPLFAALNVNASASGKVKANVDAKIKNGQFENLEGKVKADNLDITGDLLKGDRLQSSKFQADVKLNTTEKSINIDRLKIEADGLTADIKGTVPKTLTSLEAFLQADSPDSLQAQFDCDVAKTFRQVKTIANFKPDFDINYGRLSGNVSTDSQNGKRTLSGKIKLWALEGKFPVKRIILSKPVEFDAKIVSQKDQVFFEKLNIDSSFAKANLTGTTENMNYTADVDLANFKSDVGQFFEIKPELSGSARLIGKGSLINRVFASAGNASLTNIVIKMPDGKIISEPTAAVDFDFSADIEKQLLSAKTVNISAGAGKISITNLSSPFGTNTTAPLKFNALLNAELEKLMPYLTVFGGINPQSQYAGLVKGDIAMTKTDSIIEASTKQTSITNLKIASPGKETFTQPNMTIAFTGKFDTARKIYEIPTLNVISPQIKISGSLSNAEVGANVKTQGDFKADYDLAAVSSIISPFTPAGFSATGKRSDSLWFSSTYPKNASAQFTSNLNAKTTFGFDRAEYMGLQIGASTFDVKIDNGLMTIAPFTSTVNTGKLYFGASANFSEKPALLKTPGQMNILDSIQITQQTSDIFLGYINPLFANATNVSGVLSFDCEKLVFPLEKGYDKTIAVIGTLSITNMRLGSPLLNQILQILKMFQITDLPSDPIITVQPTKFIVAEGIISYNNMQMDIDKYPVNFAGQIGLDKSMRMTVTLPWTRNEQRVTLPLKGTVDRPEIDINKLLEQQLQQELENQLRKGLEQLLKK
jgi:hypothetical protein